MLIFGILFFKCILALEVLPRQQKWIWIFNVESELNVFEMIPYEWRVILNRLYPDITDYAYYEIVAKTESIQQITQNAFSI